MFLAFQTLAFSGTFPQPLLEPYLPLPALFQDSSCSTYAVPVPAFQPSQPPLDSWLPGFIWCVYLVMEAPRQILHTHNMQLPLYYHRMDSDYWNSSPYPQLVLFIPPSSCRRRTLGGDRAQPDYLTQPFPILDNNPNQVPAYQPACGGFCPFWFQHASDSPCHPWSNIHAWEELPCGTEPNLPKLIPTPTAW